MRDIEEAVAGSGETDSQTEVKDRSGEAMGGDEHAWPAEQRGVMIAGENPMIVLYRPGSDEVIAIASVWTSRYSPAGTGRVLIIWCDPEATGLGEAAPVGIFADNPELATYVWVNFYKDYEPIHGHGIDDLPVREAHFEEVNEGPDFHRISCRAGSTSIDLEWRDALDVFQKVTYPTGFEVSVIAVPCARAAIVVNGTAGVGEVHHPEGWFGSSAISAFAETWIALETAPGDEDAG